VNDFTIRLEGSSASGPIYFVYDCEKIHRLENPPTGPGNGRGGRQIIKPARLPRAARQVGGTQRGYSSAKEKQMAKILVVDDDPDVVEACRIFLEKEGHEVDSAGSRREGMAAIGKQTPDLLILDVMMDQPDDGLGMARELRQGGFTQPILMLTSVSRVSGIEIGKDDDVLPVDEFVEKPVEPAVLAAKVNELLSK